MLLCCRSSTAIWSFVPVWPISNVAVSIFKSCFHALSELKMTLLSKLVNIETRTSDNRQNEGGKRNTQLDNDTILHATFAITLWQNEAIVITLPGVLRSK